MNTLQSAPVRNMLANGQALELIHSEVLFIKDMAVTSIFLVVSGSVLAFSADGSELRRLVGPMQIIGITDALAGGLWRGIGVAHGRVELVAYDFQNLQRALCGIPRSHRGLLEDLFRD